MLGLGRERVDNRCLGFMREHVAERQRSYSVPDPAQNLATRKRVQTS